MGNSNSILLFELHVPYWVTFGLVTMVDMKNPYVECWFDHVWVHSRMAQPRIDTLSMMCEYTNGFTWACCLVLSDLFTASMFGWLESLSTSLLWKMVHPQPELCSELLLNYTVVSSNGIPQIIHFKRIFPYKPWSLSYPYFSKLRYTYILYHCCVCFSKPWIIGLVSHSASSVKLTSYSDFDWLLT